MVNLKIPVILSLLLVLLVGITSAQTLIAGKIYEADHITPIPNVNITVYCDSAYLDTTSLDDGTYAVVFSADSCGVVNVTSEINNSIIMKVVLFIPNEQQEDDDNGRSSGGGGSGSSRYYLCGNGICDSGETINTCPQDCPFELLTYENAEDDEEKEETQETSDQEETPKTTFSKITGAVTGTLGKTGTWMAGIFILIIIGTFGIVKFRKRKEK